MSDEVYEGLSRRTGGTLSLAVLGGAGTGKSTFVHSLERAFGSEEGSGQAQAAGLMFRFSENGKGNAAVLLSSDGTVNGARSETVAQEETLAASLQGDGIPFVVVLNSDAPHSGECEELRKALQGKYGVPVLAYNCAEERDWGELWEKLLLRFPAKRFDFCIPEWLRVLHAESNIVANLIQRIREISAKIVCMEDCSALAEAFAEGDVYCESLESDLSQGVAVCTLAAREGLFHRVLGEECGEELSDELQLMSYVRGLREAKQFYEKYGAAFRRAEECGYGITRPQEDDLKLQPPQLYKKGTRSGVKLSADACTYHIIKVDVHSEISPVAGESARGEELARGIVESYEKDPQALWNTDMFGKTFKEMVGEGLQEKTVPEEARGKLRRAVTRIVNEGKGGVICILL